MLNIKIVTWSLSLWTALAFVTCVLYGLFTPESLRMHSFLEEVLPGFRWLTWSGFAIGLVESFLCGAYAGLTFVLIHNALAKRWPRQSN